MMPKAIFISLEGEEATYQHHALEGSGESHLCHTLRVGSLCRCNRV